MDHHPPQTVPGILVVSPRACLVNFIGKHIIQPAIHSTMSRSNWLTFLLVVASVVCMHCTEVRATGSIRHDAEFEHVRRQHAEAWLADDAKVQQRLEELREKHGSPPNIVHLLWDDTAFGDAGIPAISKVG
jgi:formate hydrogenlyase subunit 6/NADH:ubiquinone oxidoreductase subunit I